MRDEDHVRGRRIRSGSPRVDVDRPLVVPPTERGLLEPRERLEHRATPPISVPPIVWQAMTERIERTERERTAGAAAAVSLIRRNRDFRRLFLASVISLGGDWFLFVALGGLVLQVTGQALSVGILIMSQELPIFVATPWAGWLTDRFDRRRLMIACDVARTVICVAFLAVGPENLWLAYTLLVG